MQPYSIAGLFLILFGIFAMAVRSVTYFTTETVVGPLGFFAWDVSQPHTLFFSPLVGLLALIVGIGLVLMDRRTTAA
jgi:hypothetical protein